MKCERCMTMRLSITKSRAGHYTASVIELASVEVYGGKRHFRTLKSESHLCSLRAARERGAELLKEAREERGLASVQDPATDERRTWTE